MNTNIFDRRLWKRFWEISRLYWFSEDKWKARGILALLLVLLFGFTALNVILSFVCRDFMTALAEKNLPDFNKALLLYLGAFVVATPVSVFYSFIRKKLGINWRLWLTTHFLGKYFENRAYYLIFRGSLDDLCDPGPHSLRDNVESIAFYRGEDREKNQVKQRLREVVGNLRMLIGWERNLEFFTRGYEYFILVLPVVVMAPLYFSDQIKFGVVTQAEGAFVQVLGALSIIVSQFEQLSNFVAGITRLETFATALDKSAAKATVTSPVIESREDSRLALEHVTLHTPNYQQTLLMDATAEVPPGKGLLIAGASGAGKSSVLRAIAGLWNAGEGNIARPPLKEMLFLPQRPYMVLGSLREQLLYPRLEQEAADDELRAVLKMVNLADLPERVGGFEAEMDWGHLLSLGEQQRLAFARLLLTQPHYAVLDEATSALDVTNETQLYGQLQKSGTTYISVGHRPSLIAYHDKVLELRGGGEWRLVPAAEFHVAPPPDA